MLFNSQALFKKFSVLCEIENRHAKPIRRISFIVGYKTVSVHMDLFKCENGSGLVSGRG